MNNLSSYCGLVDVRISTSDKDLPVLDSNKIKGDFIQIWWPSNKI